MKALITDGNCKIGVEISKILNRKGYELILVGKNKKKLEKIADEIGDNIQIIATDISSTYNCNKLYNKIKDEDIEIVINCANNEIVGEFSDSKIDSDLDLIDLNIKAVHTLTKLFLKDFEKKDSGYILNISSIIAFSAYPLMATYSASKSYVSRLTIAINEELKKKKSNVYVGCFYPIALENDNFKFNNTITSTEVAEIAIEQMFKRKKIIVPKFSKKITTYLSKLLPRKTLLKLNYSLKK